MPKRDRYRDEPDWDDVTHAYDAQRAAAVNNHEMRDLMMPSDYTPCVRVHGRLRPR